MNGDPQRPTPQWVTDTITTWNNKANPDRPIAQYIPWPELSLLLAAAAAAGCDWAERMSVIMPDPEDDSSALITITVSPTLRLTTGSQFIENYTNPGGSKYTLATSVEYSLNKIREAGIGLLAEMAAQAESKPE